MPTLDPTSRDRWPDSNAAGEHLWFDFEPANELSADGSGDPDIHYLTIADPDGEEIATICHRANSTYPIDGELAEHKRLTAQWVVDALNAYNVPQPTMDDARRAMAERSNNKPAKIDRSEAANRSTVHFHPHDPELMDLILDMNRTTPDTP